MYIVRYIFHLRFGSYSEAKVLMNELFQKRMLPPASNVRVLSDFSGGSYRMIMEGGLNHWPPTKQHWPLYGTNLNGGIGMTVLSKWWSAQSVKYWSWSITSGNAGQIIACAIAAGNSVLCRNWLLTRCLPGNRFYSHLLPVRIQAGVPFPWNSHQPGLFRICIYVRSF